MDEEAHRLATLRDLQLVSQEPSDALKRLFAATERLFGVDVAGIGIVDEETSHIWTRHPWMPRTSPRAISFGGLVVDVGRPVIVADTHRDPALRRSPARRSGIRFLAGVPLHAPGGIVIGTFALAHREPREPSEADVETLTDLGRVADALVQLQSLEYTLNPQRSLPEDVPSILKRLDEQAPTLAASLGLEHEPRPLQHPVSRWARYDPTLVRLMFRKGAGEVLRHLHDQPFARFKDFLQATPSLNQRTLTTRLRELQEAGLIRRQAYAEVPPRVEYTLAPDARELVAQLLTLLEPPPMFEE